MCTAHTVLVLGGHFVHGAQLWPKAACLTCWFTCCTQQAVSCCLLQGQLKVQSWRLDSEDKQTLAITGLFSIQAVRLLQQQQRSQAA
jgi:hypothetical protein